MKQPPSSHRLASAAGLHPRLVVDDLSAWIISGAVKSEQPGTDYETDGRTPAQGVQDGMDAERLGFRRVFLSERWDIKEAGVILSAVAARTSRLGVATGLIAPVTRHPWQTAAFAATMQACHGPRFVLGLGMGESAIFPSMGIDIPTYKAMADYVDIVRRLWRGETVSYEGPVGSFPALAFSDRYEGPPPPIWLGTFARPRGARLAAESFDGVVLPTMLTVQATRRAVERLREACERADRDPATLHIAQGVVTAPDLDDNETRSLAHARAVGYLQYPGYGEVMVQENGWDPEQVQRVRTHRQLAAEDKVADRVYHRHELLGPAALVPDEWMHETCALGSVAACVGFLARLREAGVDEVVTYGSTPGQNAGLIDAWRARLTVAA